MDEIFNNCISSHKKIDLDLNKNDLLSPYIKSETEINLTKFRLKRIFYFGSNTLVGEDLNFLKSLKIVLQPLVQLDT